MASKETRTAEDVVSEDAIRIVKKLLGTEVYAWMEAAESRKQQLKRLLAAEELALHGYCGRKKEIRQQRESEVEAMADDIKEMHSSPGCSGKSGGRYKRSS